MAFNPDLFGINIGQEFQSGVNTSFPGTYISQWVANEETIEQLRNDIRHLKSLGFKRFRFAAPDISSTDRNEMYKILITAVVEEGDLHIEWGLLPLGNFNAWRTWVDALDPYAQWFQTLINTHASNGVTGKWIIGNEEEFSSHRNGSTPTSMVRSSNVVTITMGTNHWLDTGFWINVNNSSLVTAGSYAVTSTPTANTFTISSTGSDGSTSNNGSISFDIRGTRQFQKKLATHLKSLTSPSITMPIVVCCAQGEEAPGIFWNFEPWATGTGTYPYVGKGSVDEIQLNVYSKSNSNLDTNYSWFKSHLDDAYALFGSNFTISEWNNYEDDTTARIPNNDLEKRMELLLRRRNLIESYNMPHYYFAYRMPSKLAEKHPAYNNTGGGIRPSLFKLIGKKSPYIEYLPL